MILNDIIFDSIIIEATRRCNMSCPHCLRGDAQNVDMNISYIDSFLSNFKNKNVLGLLFTGGETTLAPEIIDYTLNCLVKFNIHVGHIEIFSNGKSVSNKFISIWNKYCDKFMMDFYISFDDYHEQLSDNDYLQLSKLRNVQSKFLNADETNIAPLGRAKNNFNITTDMKLSTLRFSSFKNYLYVYSPLVLLCNSSVLYSCDYEFNDDLKYLLCNCNDDIVRILFDKSNLSTLIPFNNLYKVSFKYKYLERLELLNT